MPRPVVADQGVDESYELAPDGPQGHLVLAAVGRPRIVEGHGRGIEADRGGHGHENKGPRARI